mgnify:FL=1
MPALSVFAGIVFVSVLITSFISGIFGMAGGIILMGVYAFLQCRKYSQWVLNIIGLIFLSRAAVLLGG